MKKTPSSDPDMQDDYDFSGGVRGKYAKLFPVGANVVVLDPDVAEVFPDSESVNRTLRAIGQIIRQQVPKVSGRRVKQTGAKAAGTPAER